MSTIRSVDRTFSILQLVAQHPQGIGVTTIAEDLSLAKSTVSRLLSTMQSWGVVEKTENHRFRIGPEPARWVHQQEKGQTLAQRIQPILHAIAAETQEAAAFCVLEGDVLLYQKIFQSNQNIQMRDWEGERFPPHTVSPGKLLLAYAEREAIERYLATPLVALTKKTVTDPQTLRTQLAAIRANGFSIADEEFGEGIVGMAVPIVDKSRPAPESKFGAGIRSESRSESRAATTGEAAKQATMEAKAEATLKDRVKEQEKEQEKEQVNDKAVVAALCVYGPKFRLSSLGMQMEIIKIMQNALT